MSETFLPKTQSQGLNLQVDMLLLQIIFENNLRHEYGFLLKTDRRGVLQEIRVFTEPLHLFVIFFTKDRNYTNLELAKSSLDSHM
jgi:hypothetical protein